MDCVTVDLGLAGWCHGTKRGRGPRWLTLLLITYLNLTVLIVSPSPCPSPVGRLGTASLQEVDCGTVNLTLAGWRHGTKRGRVAGVWYYLLLVQHYIT